MTTLEITCPSGLSGEVRIFTVREYNILADRRNSQRTLWTDKILQNCWLRTIDAGPYELGEAGLDWSNVLQGDRFYILLQLRVASLGDDYDFSVSCQQCGEQIAWHLSLQDLPIRKLTGESLERFKGGNRFECTLPGCGKKVTFRLAVGGDEKRFSKLRKGNPESLWSVSLLQRIVEIDGVSNKRAFVDELSISDAEFLRQEFDVVDCGVDTTIEIECPSCYAVQLVDLPFGPQFLLPDRKKRCSR